ncbi:MAG TPA: SDR family oxidoreductase [Candidatus Limnocylindrales bacterium]|nr:SDR family oxidoreductase [Candidatus Limnocylindrales bacterium]
MTNARDQLALVTGATGFLGSALVVGLLEKGYAVRCVVRGESDVLRVARLRAALDGVDNVTWSRVEVVEGDLALDGLGLSPGRFAALGEDVGLVVHAGARVNMRLPYESLHDTNVRGTQLLLRVAEAASASFAYTGSLAAVAYGTVGEPFELIEPVSGGYGQTKWTADRLVCAGHREGRVKAVILRAGRITAHSVTGRSNPADLLEQVLRCCVRLGAIPDLPTRIRVSPLDWVTNLMLDLCEAQAAFGKAHHLATEEVFPWAGVVDALRAAGYDLPLVPYDEWRAMVAAAGRDEPGLARLARGLPTQTLSFDKRPVSGPVNARAVFADAFLELPPAAELLARTLAAWQRIGVLPAVGAQAVPRRTLPG